MAKRFFLVGIHNKQFRVSSGIASAYIHDSQIELGFLYTPLNLLCLCCWPTVTFKEDSSWAIPTKLRYINKQRHKHFGHNLSKLVLFCQTSADARPPSLSISLFLSFVTSPAFLGALSCRQWDWDKSDAITSIHSRLPHHPRGFSLCHTYTPIHIHMFVCVKGNWICLAGPRVNN